MYVWVNASKQLHCRVQIKIISIHVNIMGKGLGMVKLCPVQAPVLQSKGLSRGAPGYTSLRGH